MFADAVLLMLFYTVAVSYVNEVIIISFSTYTVAVNIISTNLVTIVSFTTYM